MLVKNMKTRNRLRKLQNRFLKHILVKNHIERHGKDFPIFEKGASYNDLKKCIYPEHEKDIKFILMERN